MNKYDWLATESAPKGLPMQIVKGDFYDHEGGGLYVPDTKTIRSGWGTGVSIHIVGADTKTLPNRLEVTFFSYLENKFYSGEFDLPYDRILNLFSSGYFSPRMDDQKTYREIIVGIAPGGTVSVWASGPDKRVELINGKAKLVDLPWSRLTPNTSLTREDYIEKVLDQVLTKEELKYTETQPIDYRTWSDSYRKRYSWFPVLSGVQIPKLIGTHFFLNGEVDYYSPAYGNDWLDQKKAVPQKMVIAWKSKNGQPVNSKIFFDEESIFSAFKEITQSHNGKFNLNIDIEDHYLASNYKFSLQFGNKVVEIKNVTVENYTFSSTERNMKHL